MILKPL
jgi:hypothetical protein